MARKTAGTGSSVRNKPKSTAPSSAISVAPEARKNVVPGTLEDEIRRRAYEIYLERGGVPGNQNDDWVAAEREVRERCTQSRQTA